MHRWKGSWLDKTHRRKIPHCICFFGFKQDQLRSTIFNSKSCLRRCIVFCLSPFWKEVEWWKLDLFISLIPGALYFENSAKVVPKVTSSVSLVSLNKGLKWYTMLWHLNSTWNKNCIKAYPLLFFVLKYFWRHSKRTPLRDDLKGIFWHQESASASKFRRLEY